MNGKLFPVIMYISFNQHEQFDGLWPVSSASRQSPTSVSNLLKAVYKFPNSSHTSLPTVALNSPKALLSSRTEWWRSLGSTLEKIHIPCPNFNLFSLVPFLVIYFYFFTIFVTWIDYLSRVQQFYVYSIHKMSTYLTLAI